MSMNETTEQTGRNGKRYTPMIEIMAAVCKQYGTNQREIRSRSRHDYLVAARRLFIFRVMEEAHPRHRSYSAIGRHINRDHTTVRYHFLGLRDDKHRKYHDAKRSCEPEASRHSAGHPCSAGHGCPGG